MFWNCPSFVISFFKQFFILTWNRGLWSDHNSHDGTKQQNISPGLLNRMITRAAARAEGRRSSGGTVFLLFHLNLFKRYVNICHLIQLSDLHYFYKCLKAKQQEDFLTRGLVITDTSATQKTCHEMSSLTLRAMLLEIHLLTFKDHK